MRSISRIPPRDGPICSARRAVVAAAVLLADPGIDGEEVVAAENPKQSLRGVGPEAVLGGDRAADLLGGDLAALPGAQVELSARDAPRETHERDRAIAAADLRLQAGRRHGGDRCRVRKG